MLPESRSVVVYGGGGKVGGEGARGSLAGRIGEALDEVAEEIRSVGGVPETARADAFDESRGEENTNA